jgi:hypothetical protein
LIWPRHGRRTGGVAARSFQTMVANFACRRPVHIIVQLKDGVPLPGIFQPTHGNFGRALLAAISVRYFVKVGYSSMLSDAYHFCSWRRDLAPVFISSIAAYLYVLSSLEHEYWYVWRAPILSNACPP